MLIYSEGGDKYGWRKHKSRIKINYFIVEIDQNELINKKHKKISTTLNYTEQFLVLASAVTGCVSLSIFVL